MAWSTTPSVTTLPGSEALKRGSSRPVSCCSGCFCATPQSQPISLPIWAQPESNPPARMAMKRSFTSTPLLRFIDDVEIIAPPFHPAVYLILPLALIPHGPLHQFPGRRDVLKEAITRRVPSFRSRVERDDRDRHIAIFRLHRETVNCSLLDNETNVVPGNFPFVRVVMDDEQILDFVSAIARIRHDRRKSSLAHVRVVLNGADRQHTHPVHSVRRVINPSAILFRRTPVEFEILGIWPTRYGIWQTQHQGASGHQCIRVRWEWTKSGHRARDDFQPFPRIGLDDTWNGWRSASAQNQIP